MAIKTVAFVEDFYYDGNTRVHRGTKLLEEFFDTKTYRKLNPGDLYEVKTYRGTEILEMVAAEPFDATLRIVTGGAKTITLLDEKNMVSYPMFYSDFASMSMNSTITYGVVTGRFGFVKKNVNFGIEFISEL